MAVYTSGLHNFHKAMGKAGVVFPMSKADIIKALGDLQVQVSADSFVSAASLVEPMVPTDYENGAAFYNAFVAASNVALKEAINY